MKRDVIAANEAVARIYANFRWQLKLRNHSYQEIMDLLTKAQEECREKVLDDNIRDLAITGFEQMKARTSEFTCTTDDE